ncbi:hypothetical protein BGZ96_005313 [Linnemannia gamsii]|uniref:Uncharacterized protein n=1 Tax=Linnemannia gamsii TaxID=64522 RepID=A0ABQ7K5Q2_9FUNG|nr:hypothetical protein BGZ96_005313 [Linnemannia gamsii]
MPSDKICMASPPLLCTKNADCNTAYSFCQNNNGTMMCIGLGTPGSSDYCPDQTLTPKTDGGDSSLTPTIKYAGIAVGCVAALGLLFAGVRWQRRRQRSKVPENMFGEIDYGMTDRSAPKSAEQTYPFSSRPHAHGSDHSSSAPHDNGGYDNQYYDDGYQKDQYYGNDQYNSNNQYYGNQQDNYGHDHHSGHGGQGGFYDNADYNDYPQNGGHQSPIATPVAAVRSPRQNNYGAEPSELDYGGHGGNGGYGHGGHGGQGGQGGQGGYY